MAPKKIARCVFAPPPRGAGKSFADALANELSKALDEPSAPCLVVKVPDSAQPGCIIQVDPGEGDYYLHLALPSFATPGDQLFLIQTKAGEWTFSKEEVASSRRREALAEVLGEVPKTLTVEVPPDAVPGQTELELGTGTQCSVLMVTVPEEAIPGDLLVLRRDSAEDDWKMSITRRQAVA